MAKKRVRSGLYRLLSSKRVRDKYHPKVKERDRVTAEGAHKRIRSDEFTWDDFDA
jgi:hypothetical protein